MNDHLTNANSEPRMSRRRDLIKKALALGPAMYVAPAILGSTTTVSAISGAGVCTGGVCGTYTNCLGNQSCFCFTLANGSSYCGTSVSCASIQSTCSVQNPCAAGFVCEVGTCCSGFPNGNICVPTSTQCTAGTTGSPNDAGKGVTSTGK